MGAVKDENYINIQGWMVNQLHLKGNELLVYAIIYGFSQAEGQVFSGGLRYLSDWLNTSKRTVMDNLKLLTQKDLIEKEEEFINGVKFCKYRCKNFSGVVKNLPQGIEESSMGGIEKSSPNNKYINNKDKLNNINNNLSKSEKQTSKNYEFEFNELWNEYPRKQGKEKALQAYIKARKDGVDKDIILTGIRAYKAFITANRTDSKYIKQGSTWFNQKCWEDDYNIDPAAITSKPTSTDFDYLDEMEEERTKQALKLYGKE